MSWPESQDLSRAKAELRAAARAELQGFRVEYRARASIQACQLLQDQDVWRHASAILFFAALRDELDLSSLIEAALEERRVVALPQFDAASGVYQACPIHTPIGQLPIGQFGIREPGRNSPPVPLKQLDLVLVPGLAFDLSGHRLGRGRGFYDRLLREVGGIKCGLGYDEQLKAQIPVEPHDVLLDCIVTPARWLDLRRGRLGDDLVG